MDGSGSHYAKKEKKSKPEAERQIHHFHTRSWKIISQSCRREEWNTHY
jgi:hypothetical protein